MSTIDKCGHLGYALLLTGQLLVSRKKASGWLVRLIGESICIILGVEMGMTSIVVWGIVDMAVNTYGYISWNKE